MFIGRYLFLFFFFSVFSFGNIIKTDIKKIRDNFDNISVEVKNIKKYIKESKEIEKDIYNFRINFSSQITLFATNETRKTDYEDVRENLSEWEDKVSEWLNASKEKKERIKDLLKIIKQASKSYKSEAKKARGKKRKILQSLRKKGREHSRELAKNQVLLKNHINVLDKVYRDIKSWETFLLEQIKKRVDTGLLKWRLNTFYFSPIVAFNEFLSEFKKSWSQYEQFRIKSFITKNIKVIFLRLFITLSIFFLTLYLFFRLESWFESSSESLNNSILMNSLEILSKNKFIVSYWGVFSIIIKDFGPLSYLEYPKHLNFLIVVVILSIFLIKVINPILKVFFKVINEGKEKIKGREYVAINWLIILIFIFTRSLQVILGIESDFLYFMNSLLLLKMGAELFKLCIKFKIETEEYGKLNLALVLKSTKGLILTFSGAIVLSSLIEIIGFLNLGRSIQTIVFNNIIYFTVSWIIFQSASYFLLYKRNLLKRGKNYNHKLAFIRLLRNFFNTSFLIGIIYLMFYSGHKAIFIFADFWEIALIKIGGYRFTIDEPIKLLIAYFFLRFFYVISVYCLDAFLLERFNISRKYASNVSSILRYILIFIFISIFLATLGVTYKNLVIFASALGVGIGFGLQNIVNNFISGIILLFEQPIRVGDMIQVGDDFVRVKHIGIRCTIVESLDNSSMIIPNSDIVSNKLVNWTLNNNIIAIRCLVGVAYGTDTKKVSKILNEIGKENEDILTYPAHEVWFQEFAESSLEFVLKIWINDPSKKFVIHSDIMHAINLKFIENGIKIPFPQRDVYLHENP